MLKRLVTLAEKCLGYQKSQWFELKIWEHEGWKFIVLSKIIRKHWFK